LVVEDTERGVTAGPLRQQVDSMLQVLGGLRSLSSYHRGQPQAPRQVSRGRNTHQPLLQCLLRAGEIMVTKLDQSQRQVVLVVVRISAYGVAKNLDGLAGVARMGLDVSQQSEKSVVGLPGRGNLLGSLERLRIMSFAEICIGEVELHVIGIRICLESCLEVLNRIVVPTISRKQTPNPGLRAIVVRTHLIKLCDGRPRNVDLSKLQISLGQEIQILRLPRMLLDLRCYFRDIEFGPFLGRKRGTVVEIVEKVLIRIGAGARIF